MKYLLFCLLLVGLFGNAKAQYVAMQTDASPLQLQLGVNGNDRLNPLLENGTRAVGANLKIDGSVLLKQQGWWLQADYQASYQRWQLASDAPDMQEDEQGAELGLLWRGFLSRSWHWDWFARYQLQDEAYGTGISRQQFAQRVPDRRKMAQLGSRLLYGNDKSARFVSVAVDGQQIRYDSPQRYVRAFERDQLQLTVQSGFRWSSWTRLLLKVNYQQQDYITETSKDSELVQGLAGFAWRFSGSSELTALLGAYQRSYKANQQNDSGVNWQLTGIYRPRDDWRLSLQSAQQSVASDKVQALDTLRTRWQGKATYLYSEQWQFAVMAQWVRDRYHYSNSDSTASESDLGIQVTLQQNQHQHWQVTLATNKVNDDQAGLDYQQTTASVHWLYAF